MSDQDSLFDLKEYTLNSEEKKVKLTERFIVPPFSVFDTRQGYWQERKRKWIELGIKSETGRDQTLTYGETEGETFFSGIVADRGGGISIFDPVLCELVYKWFCPENGIVIDPFSGGSVRGIVAHILGHKYYGIDLNKEQIDANNKQADEIIPNNKPNWYNGDSKDIYTILPKGIEADFILTCPPYYDLEQYSINVKDLSNMTWYSFKTVYDDILYKTCQLLKPNRFACIVISEVRDSKGLYRGLVPYTILSMTEHCYMQYYNEIILVNSVGSLPVRIVRQFNSGRKVGRVHQNILIFYKGNSQDVGKYFKELNFAETRTD